MANEGKNNVQAQTKKQIQQQILDLLLEGKSPEEIYESRQFADYSLSDIKEIESKNLSGILALKLLTVRDISNVLGVRVQNIYSSLRNKTYRGKSISTIIKEKQAEVERRLAEGQSIEDISNDKELNVDVNAVKRIQDRQKKRRNKKRMILKKDDEAVILGLLLLGKTPDEINKLEQYREYPIEAIQSIEDRNRLRILAIQLMPLEEIEKRTGRRVLSIQQNIRKFFVEGKSILALRKDKEEEVIRRLSEGQSVENILADRELNVCREGVESIIERQNTITWKQAVLEELLSGKTPEEISKLEQFEGHSIEEIQRIANKNMLRIQAIQLVPEQELANRFGRRIGSVRVNLSNFKINGMSLSQIRREKIAEVERRLAEGQSTDEIIADRVLNVSKEGVESIRDGLKKKKQPKAKKTSRIQRQRIIGYLLLGKIPEEIQNIDGFREMSLGDIEIIRQQNEARILASQLMPVREISNMVGVQVNSIYANLREFSIEGKSISQIRREKEAEVEKRLREGQSVDDIIGDAELNVCRQGVESIKARIEKQKRKKRSTNIQIEETEENSKDGVGLSPEEEEAHKQLEVMRKKYRERYESQDESFIPLRKYDQKNERDISHTKKDKASTDIVPQEIQSIISGIACGDIDVDSAKQVVGEQARRKVKGLRNKFAMTEKQERNVIMAQIRKILSEQGDRFPIDNPEKTILILQELSGTSLTTSLNVVVRNQLARRKFEEAEQLCDEYGIIKKDNIPISAYIRGLKRMVRSAKIGDLVYRTINSELSPEDEAKFWKLLQDGLKLGNVRMGDITLGKTRDERREITLDDIWPENLHERKK